MVNTIASQDIPEQGQIANIRRRRYIVNEVTQSLLPTDPLQESSRQLHHLIRLSSIEDDGLGETIEVVWEIEPGAEVTEKVALPAVTAFDTPDRLDAFLDAVRWGAVSQADTRILQAPFRSGIEIEDYQLDPLVRAVQMPRVSLLIADDVGLGKTIESGLVAQELIVRNRVRKVLIVCPAGLQVHWRDQMRDKFGLEFRIVDSQMMKQLRRNRGIHTNPWTHFPRLITSIDYIKLERPMRLMRDILLSDGGSRYPRKFDMLIVDEAHNIAPSGSGKYAIDSMRTQAIRELVPHFEHKLFLSATPHNGYQESFTALLELLDNQRFARGVLPDEKQLRAVMVRRLKSELVGWDGKPRFPQRQLKAIEVSYTDEERQVHQALNRYTKLRIEHAKDSAEKYATEFVLKLLKKRLFSSPQAFLDTLAKHEHSLLTAMKSTERRSQKAFSGVLRRQITQIDEDYADDDEYETATESAIDSATRLFRLPSIEEEALLRQMKTWAEVAVGQRDQKTRTLIAWLQDTLKPEGSWSDERVIIFTEYRATQNWLQNILTAEGFGGDRLMTLYGGMPDDKREQVKAAFQAHPSQSAVRILLATDAASEGIDLQNYCHRLIHIEIPWNPNRMEQRNGRIDRHGQKHNPQIYHFAPAGFEERTRQSSNEKIDALDADLEFLMRAVQKVEQIREDLGKVGPVIAEQVQEAMLGYRRTLQTSQAEADNAQVKRMLKFERDLQKQIEEQMQQYYQSRQTLKLSPENIRAVTEMALELAHQQPLRPHPTITGAYDLPSLTGSWARASEGLKHPHTGETRPIVFDEDLVREYGDRVVLAHLNHRLVQMALRLLRTEVWSAGGQSGLQRVTARIVPDYAIEGNTPAVIAHGRLVVIGGDNQRLHEEIIVAGGIISPRYRRLNVGQIERALEEQTSKPVSPAVQKQLIDYWYEQKIEESLMQTLEARADDYTNRLKRMLEERITKEQNDIASILTELARAIEDELDEPEMRQLDLPGFSDEDRSIHKDALRARLAEIPDEIEREQEQIRRRFENPQPRLFPVAITFLVPERLNR